MEGGDPLCSFHHTGSSDRLYVFEAPIDLLSFLTRYPKGWQEHSFVSLCGTSEHAMLWMLEQNPGIHSVCLCLDHDEAGIEASGRLAEILHEHGYDDVGVIQPEYKDWNEDVKALRGFPAQAAEEHPQLMRVYLPSDRHQTKKLVEALLKDEQGAYIRVGRNPVEDIYTEDACPFEMNKVTILAEGTDILLVACGEMVRPAKEAAERLKKGGISAVVLDMYCVKPGPP